MLSLTTLRLVDALLLAAGSWIIYSFFQTVRRRARTTKLGGPPSRNWLWGVSRDTFRGESGALLYEQWAKEHGAVFSAPGIFGSQRIVLTDPKAISHFYANETYTYLQNDIAKKFIETLVRVSIKTKTAFVSC